MKSYRPYLCEKYIDEPFPRRSLNTLRECYFFRPVQAGMAVYMATPHRGAPMARYRLVNAIMGLVELPQNIVNEVINIATLQNNTVLQHPEKLTRWFTSANQLTPDSYSIRGLQRLSVRPVPTYSVIGNFNGKPTEKSSDGVIPYWSSHLPWGAEKIVAWDHSVQDSPQTADYLREILLRHLHQ